jgi:transcriptional regulator with XRE-family HTH domain
MSKGKAKYDFTAMGKAIKEARKKMGWTRERLAQEVDLAPRYIMNIENKGQHPSFQKFIELVTFFNISVDPFLYPDNDDEKSTRRRQLDTELDELDERDYIVLEATAKGLKEAKNR